MAASAQQVGRGGHGRRAFCECPVRVCLTLPEDTSHILTAWSAPEASTCLASQVNATSVTVSVIPCSTPVCCPEMGSHSRTTLSAPPLATLTPDLDQERSYSLPMGLSDFLQSIHHAIQRPCLLPREWVLQADHCVSNSARHPHTQSEASQHKNCQLLRLPLSAQVNASTSAGLPARLSQPHCVVHWRSTCRPASVHILRCNQ